jgi:hypothetical protein
MLTLFTTAMKHSTTVTSSPTWVGAALVFWNEYRGRRNQSRGRAD